MIAGVETGGTKVVCGLVRREAPRELVATARIPTTTPGETLAAVDAFLAAAADPIEAVGVASFGPLNVEPGRARYGWITGSPKREWVDTDLLGGIRLAGQVPTALLSDVSGAALGEHRWGAAVGTRSAAYATVGTGVGVGVVVDGRVLHGDGFPELGHLLVRRHPEDGFEGACRFHGDCLEGLVAGPSLRARWGIDAGALAAETRDRALPMLGSYLAQVAAVTAYATGVERMVLGGGVLQMPGLLEAARMQLARVTGGPGAGHAAALDALDFLVPPGLGHRSGLLGAIAAALDLLEARS